MNWYKESQNNQLAQTVAIWLVQAYRGPIDIELLHQDLNMLMPTVDDPSTLQSAIQQGELMARQQTNNMMLTPVQQEVIQEIYKRFENPDSPPEGSLQNVPSGE